MVEVLERVNNMWWWVECEGVAGYAPTNHLSTCRPDPDEDCWENEEYFTSYGHMVNITLVIIIINIHYNTHTLEASSRDVIRSTTYTSIQDSN